MDRKEEEYLERSIDAFVNESIERFNIDEGTVIYLLSEYIEKQLRRIGRWKG